MGIKREREKEREREREGGERKGRECLVGRTRERKPTQ